MPRKPGGKALRDFIRKPINWMLVMLVVAVMTALFINFFASTNSNLPSYQPGTEVEPNMTEEVEEITFETVNYQNEIYGFSMPVPAGWSFVIKGGADSYVNTDGSIISFDISAYDPTLNNATQESVANDVELLNGLLGGFAWLTTSSYVVIYEVNSVDYFEYVTWDLDTLVRVTASIPANSYSDLSAQITALFDRFVWEKRNPVPDGCFMYYSDYGNFEFPVPSVWQYGIEDGNFVAISPESGANYRITVNNSPIDLSSITQLDYSQIMSSGKTNYMLRSYQTSGTILSASSSFSNNGVQYEEYHQMMTVGNYQYELLFQCPETNYDADYSTYLEVLNNFRVF